VNHEIRSL